ncbi:phospholipid carrier-dependent glycosyltransferase [Nocardioides sambongensis]|uniref:phospholipid carrier-dependent glycosyltransferase n=1 Tax=Nocardioides sambongensis TaxID=2589074 RepID=UPI001E5E247C|nr:phospholipid carrier-dependent glycosyltransferase [Nocardioides sambongensis]
MTAVDDQQHEAAGEAAGRRASLSRTAAGRPVPLARLRALNPLDRLPLSEKAIGWVAPIGLTLLAFALRLVHLGTPKRFAFDETYYAKDAWSLLNNGYIQTYLTDVDGNPKTDINADILAGHTQGVWTGEPSLAVHPDVGKWLIALGEKAFGMDPFGWRIASAVAGALMVLVLCRLVRRMTGSTLLGCVAGILLMFDGLHFVLSRLALLDIFLALFILCGVSCLVADRDWLRARLARGMAPDPGAGDEADRASYPSRRAWGPRFLFRPWLLAAGVMFGLALGTKWSAAYPLAAFGLLCWLWSAGPGAAWGSGARSSRRRSWTGSRPSCTWWSWPHSSTSPPGAGGWRTPTSTRSTSPPPSTGSSPARATAPRTTTRSWRPTWTRTDGGRPPRSRTPAGSARPGSRCARSGTTTRTPTPSTRTS